LAGAVWNGPRMQRRPRPSSCPHARLRAEKRPASVAEFRKEAYKAFPEKFDNFKKARSAPRPARPAPRGSGGSTLNAPVAQTAAQVYDELSYGPAPEATNGMDKWLEDHNRCGARRCRCASCEAAFC
jgi:hypothetical protein